MAKSKSDNSDSDCLQLNRAKNHDTIKDMSSQHSPAPTPSRAVYGAVMWLLSHLAMALYLVWALVPDTYLSLAGLDFLPQKYWAVAVPVYLSVVFFTFVFVLYPCMGMLRTPHYNDIRLGKLSLLYEVIMGSFD